MAMFMQLAREFEYYTVNLYSVYNHLNMVGVTYLQAQCSSPTW